MPPRRTPTPISSEPIPEQPTLRELNEEPALPLADEGMLAMAGVYRGKDGRLWHVVPTREGIVVRQGKKYFQVVDYERQVAPPGMEIETAQRLNLDFYHPTMGWLWGGRKRADEHPSNLGTGLGADNIRLVALEEYYPDGLSTEDNPRYEPVDEDN